MIARDFFEMVSKSVRDCNFMREVLEQEERYAGCTAANLGAGVRSSNVSDSTARAAERLASRRACYERQVDLVVRQETIAEQVIQELPSLLWGRVIELHYLRCRRLRAVADEVGCSLRSCYNILDEAMTWLDDSGIVDRALARADASACGTSETPGR